jgi:hypothetical protein
MEVRRVVVAPYRLMTIPRDADDSRRRCERTRFGVEVPAETHIAGRE